MLVDEHAATPERVRIVPTGADAGHFRPPDHEERRTAQQRFGIRPGQFVLTFIGTLNANKSPETVVEAVIDLAASGHDVVLLVAGVGPSEEALRTRAAQAGVAERVQLLGRQDCREVLWASDALVLPSRMEGFGTVVVEAMLCGVAVLRTAAGGATQQITPDVTGVIFEYGDHEGLARKVAQLIERPDLRTVMAARALEDARDRFSSASMARSVEEIYLAVLGDRR
jgi:glycosyltransferase involved in cell wall biosynthesis